jgi:hypothetical protein
MEMYISPWKRTAMETTALMSPMHVRYIFYKVVPMLQSYIERISLDNNVENVMVR